MAHWNGEQIIYWPSEPVENYSGWLWIDCGCCNGVEWGGEYPRECKQCEGFGKLAHHTKTHRLALYPGGPFKGRIKVEA